ncbi:hypothetical protein Btru_078122 [Bulinus truncatus]|nr:hypothetical protein Btru_078122 [Bulinus truncatus]
MFQILCRRFIYQFKNQTCHNLGFAALKTLPRSQRHKMLLKVLCIITIIGAVNCNCSYTTWWDTFDYKGQQKCKENNNYIRGLARFHLKSDDNLSNLEGADCCPAPSNWSNTDVLVVYEDWTLTLDDEKVWAYCPSGYFLQGLYRSDTGWPWYTGYLHNIETARCAKPATHPFYYGDCYVLDIPTFDRQGIFSCREDYYLTGLYKSGCDKLHCLDSLMCCKMADRPQEVNNVELLKHRIMSTNLVNTANLAHMMGFGWCHGNRGVNIGDDFERVGDIWMASTKYFWPSSSCDGHKCGERLKIVYDSGDIYNSHDKETEESFEKSQAVEDTITHTVINSWSNIQEAEISLTFHITYISVGLSTSYTTKYENSSSTTNEKSTQTSNMIERSTTKTLPPFSSAKYRVMLSKTRTTIPYTAVMNLKFSVEFQGFLRWGLGSTANHYYQQKGSPKTQTLSYSFGDASVPFYRSLKNQVESQSAPWLWDEMLKNYPTGRDVIDRLTDETRYEISLSGILEYVRARDVHIIWENVTSTESLPHNELSPTSTGANDIPVLALPGLNDNPVKVEFPELPSVNAKPYKPTTFGVGKDFVKVIC